MRAPRFCLGAHGHDHSTGRMFAPVCTPYELDGPHPLLLAHALMCGNTVTKANPGFAVGSRRILWGAEWAIRKPGVLTTGAGDR